MTGMSLLIVMYVTRYIERDGCTRRKENVVSEGMLLMLPTLPSIIIFGDTSHGFA